MKAWKEPKEETWGTNYKVGLTDEFTQVIKAALEKITPLSTESVSPTTTYFKVHDEEVDSEHDTCNNKKCIAAAKRNIRDHYGKGTHVEECWTDNDGDHDRIERCSVCDTPLNGYVTWCDSELQYIESEEWNAEFFKDQAFLLAAILDSMPTMDCDISGYAKHHKGKPLEDALFYRERFFQRVLKLAQAISETDFSHPEKE